MRPPARQPLTVVLAALLPALLLAGLWLGGHPEYLPGFVRDVFVANHQTLVVDEAIERIEHDYYRPISARQLSDASISGMVSSLGDRFSHYLTPKEYGEFGHAPQFTGIGVSVAPSPRGLLISRVFDDSPAKRAGLQAEELIVAVNGRTLKGVSQEAAIALIKGQPGTEVKLEIERPGEGQGRAGARRTLSITRATVSEPVVASLSETVHGVKLGVVALATFTPGAHGEVREAVQHELRHGARGLVLDLRSNGGGLVDEAQLVASIFIAKGATIVTTRGRTQPTADAEGHRRGDRELDPHGGAGGLQHRVGRGDRDGGAAGPPPRDGRGHAHVRQGRLPGGGGAVQRWRARHHGRRVLHAQRAQPGRRRRQAGRGHHPRSDRSRRG